MTIAPKSAVLVLLMINVPMLHAYRLGFGVKWIDSEFKYRVSEADSGLEAELVFPVQTAAAKISASETVGPGTVVLNAEYAFASRSPRGTDKDWQYGDMTVYSDSKTTLDQYYGFDCAYNMRLSPNWNIGVLAFFDKWQMTWSDTHQTDYVAGSSNDGNGNTVRFTQDKWGSEIYAVYGSAIGKIPFRTKLGVEMVWHESTDKHLARSFYTVSEGMLYGYHIALDVKLYGDDASVFFLEGDCRRLSGDASMNYYTKDGLKFNELPADFENRSCSVSLNYQYHF